MKTQLRIASHSLLLAVALTLAVLPASAQDLYGNGPTDGNTDAGSISFGNMVSDAFVAHIQTKANVKNNDVFWVPPGEPPTSVTWRFGTIPFSENIASGTSSLTVLSSVTNQFGYSVDTVSFSMGTLSLNAGTYWLTLENATTAGGGSAYWDENSGPSQAEVIGIGSIALESFTLESSPAASVPEPGTLALFGSGVVALAGVLRRRHSP